MNKLSKYGQNKLIIGLVSLLSMSFLASAPFENNPQNCEMISVIKKRKRDVHLVDDDNTSLPD